MNILYLTQGQADSTSLKFINDFHNIANHNIDEFPVTEYIRYDWIFIDEKLYYPKIKLLGGDTIKNRVTRYQNYNNFKHRELWT